MVDIATRVYNHKWKIDPIVRSLIDDDFYKLLMCQSIFRNKPDTKVEFSLINRSSSIRLADLIDEGELREQLDHVRSLSLTRGESTWLRGNTFYGKRQMFRPEIDSYSGFYENDRVTPTGLEGYLRSRGVPAVPIVGLATDYCVAYSALDAVGHGFRTTVLEGACRAIDLNGSLAEARRLMADAGVHLEP